MAKDDDKSGETKKPTTKKKPAKKAAKAPAKPKAAAAKPPTLKPAGGGVAPTFGVADALRQSFANYISENDVKPEKGQKELNVDLDFVKDHAGPLLASMLRDLTKSLLPKDLSFSVPVEPAAGQDGEDKSAEAAKKEGGVNVNFDFGAFLGKLFQGPAAGTDKKE